jgi:2-oxoglutarate dehydrogenase E1 component
MQPRLETAANQTAHHKGKRVQYVGRAPTSSVATGSKVAHKAEVQKVGVWRRLGLAWNDN